MDIEERKLKLAEDQWEFAKEVQLRNMKRGYDLEYLKITVIIILLIIIIFYINF
jgi:hypothetical protein